jgi:hypothetical protein
LQTDVFESLSKKLTLSESAKVSLQNKYEDASKECEILAKQVESLEKTATDYEIKNKVKEDALKKQEDLIKVLETEKVAARNESFDTDKKMKELEKTLKPKNKELHDIKKENLQLNEKLDKLNSEYSDLVAKSKNEEKARNRAAKNDDRKELLKVKFGSENLVCNLCDSRLESLAKVRNHDRIHHMEAKSVQTEDYCDIKVDKKIQVKRRDFNSDKNTATSEYETNKFEEYSCNYCGFVIVSEVQLHEHVRACHGSHPSSLLQDSKCPFTSPNQQRDDIEWNFPPPTLPVKTYTSLSFPVGFSPLKFNQTFPSPSFSLEECVHCGWKARCGTDMVNHMRSIHNDHRNPFEVFKRC